MRFSFLKPANTMRNQILAVFAAVMVIVLGAVGLLAYNLVTEIIKENAEGQIEQTAVQALGRIDTQYETIDLITSQIATDPAVQQLLQQETAGMQANFAERQSMNEIINSYQAYTTGLQSFELYFIDERRLFPLNELPLSIRVSPEWIDAAEEARGRLLWAGEDPLDAQAFLAIKQINMPEEDFQRGGYLITVVQDTYFNLAGAAEQLDIQEEYALLLDQNGQEIAGNMPEELRDDSLNGSETVLYNDEEFVRAEAISDNTGWTLVILSPVSLLLEGLPGIGTAIIIAGGTGLILFIPASWIVSSYLSRPIRQLTHAMRFGTLGALRKSRRISSTVEMNELNDTYNEMVETTNHLIKAVYEKELLKTKAELRALQAQINPHFLFNTLEAIHWTLDERDEEMAEVIISLSDLFRYTISETDDDLVTLEEELQHAERYLQIMQLRFEDRLSWRVEIDPLYREQRIPKLLIQPLIENALLHGIETCRGGGTVTVTASQAKVEGYLEISVADDGCGMSKEVLERVRASLDNREKVDTKGTGLALRNVWQRLEFVYPDDDPQLLIDSIEHTGTTITLLIPIKGGLPHAHETSTDRR
ncbi:cache domain-containing sensor histidine kinase [Alkalicoccus luteus]|uniref:cache domain-containing sensor histidine kinase n=1 Tax=Alkalicoccus luteus TaxID=1237094 RepID=UPI004034DACF